MKNLICAIFALIASGTVANATDFRTSVKDTLVYSSPAVEDSTWTSIWGAALIGYSMSNTELNFDIYDRDESFNIFHVDGFGGEGFTGDLQLGGDVQLGRFVVGAFGEYSFGGTESQVSVFEGAGQLDVEQNDSYSILARAGITSGNNNTLFYIASGYTWTEADVTLRLGDEAARQTFEFGGIPLEIGIEHKFSPNVRGRLAGRYTWYGEETVFDTGNDNEENFGARLTAEPGALSIKAGVVISTSNGLPSLN